MIGLKRCKTDSNIVPSAAKLEDTRKERDRISRLNTECILNLNLLIKQDILVLYGKKT